MHGAPSARRSLGRVATVSNQNGTNNRRLHDARQVKIRAARKRARTRLLDDKAAHDQLRRAAREGSRKTLLSRDACTEEDIERWAQAEARKAKEAHEAASGTGTV